MCFVPAGMSNFFLWLVNRSHFELLKQQTKKNARKNMSEETLGEFTDSRSISESGSGKAIHRLADGHSLKVNGSRMWWKAMGSEFVFLTVCLQLGGPGVWMKSGPSFKEITCCRSELLFAFGPERRPSAESSNCRHRKGKWTELGSRRQVMT